MGSSVQGDFTAPQNSHIHEIITLAGGQNIGEKLNSWNISREYIFQSDPDIIVIRKEDANAFVHTQPYSNLRAVREGNVFPIESVSGMGLMIGIKTQKSASDVIAKCIENGVLCLSAKDKVRLLPALNIPDDVLEKAVNIIKNAC